VRALGLLCLGEDVAGQLPARQPAEVFTPSRFREVRNEAQELFYLDYTSAQVAIAGCTVLDLKGALERQLKDVSGWPGADSITGSASL
jgi:hypothetical protein